MTCPPVRSFWVVAAGTGELRDEPAPALAAGQVRVRTRYSGVSRGTETLVFLGKVPPGEHARMRAPFQQGEFPGPVKYGYCNVGEVVEGPADLLGRIVFCLYPHQTEYTVDASAVVPLPSSVPAGRAILAANMETALNGVWDAAVRPGDQVSVIGAGAVGCLSAWLVSRIPGCEVELIDVSPARASVARDLGLPFRSPGEARAGVDVVINASGAAAGLTTALSLAGFESRVLELSWYGDTAVTLPLGEAFHSKRLRIQSSQVGHVACAQRPRWDHRRRMNKALELLREDRLDALITGESGFDELPDVIAGLAAGSIDAICHRVRY